MFGCVVGAACLVGLVGLLKHRRCHGRYGFGRHGRGCHGHGRHGHHSGFGCHGGWRGGHAHGPFGGAFDDERDEGLGEGGFFRGFALRHLFERLRTTPSQEREIARALDELKEAARGTRKDWRDTREQIARALRGEDFNAEILGAVFAQHDDVMERLRKELVGALARVHEALDERQRDELARLLERGGFGPRWA